MGLGKDAYDMQDFINSINVEDVSNICEIPLEDIEGFAAMLTLAVQMKDDSAGIRRFVPEGGIEIRYLLMLAVDCLVRVSLESSIGIEKLQEVVMDNVLQALRQEAKKDKF